MNELKKKEKKTQTERQCFAAWAQDTTKCNNKVYIHKKKKILTHPQKYEAWNYNNNTRLKCIYKKKKNYFTNSTKPEHHRKKKHTSNTSFPVLLFFP